MSDERAVVSVGLTKRYGSRTVVDELHFSVPVGSVCGLLGPNGAGKTTAIRMILGLADSDGGSSQLLGKRPGEPGFAERMREVGALVEGPALYKNAGAHANLAIRAAALGISAKDPQLTELLDLVGLGDRTSGAVRGFSLGMRQRLGLALALVGEPRLVVLDEPTNGLDPAGIVETRELIRSLPARGTTVLVSSHLLAEVQLMCDRVAIIHRGRLAAEGGLQEVLAGVDSRPWDLRTPEGGAAAVAEALAAADIAAQVSSPTSVTVPSSGEVTGARIVAALAATGVAIEEVRHDAATLEQAFLALTGQDSA